MAKIGRNEPCPCGSGIKYKRCHGSSQATAPDLERLHERSEAERIQRQRQQGLGKPIISTQFAGRRLVAVKNRLLHSKHWLTFHDFLFDYIKNALGPSWGTVELKKPPESRHPVLTWYGKVCEHQKTFVKEPGQVHSAPMTGAVAAYLHLAYDLYALDHNAELQEKLIGRLRNHERFSGARYEVFVAAAFVRAGFDIAFENEDDRNTRHCEFVATYRTSGKRFSVEAKRREGRRPRIGSLFNDAISKHADHVRVIFIDMNMRDEAKDALPPSFLDGARRRLRAFEGQPLNGVERPPAYVFITNAPWDLDVDRPVARSVVLAEGFQIPDFKFDAATDLRGAINAREAQMEMHNLLKSMHDHSEIPSTFDGELPAYAFNPEAQRVLIGEKYLIRDKQGIERPAEITAATVVEDWRQLLCGVKFDNGETAIYSAPISDDEIEAWKRHPDTFFGVVGQRTTHADSPLEFYDFWLESFKKMSKSRLLEAMAQQPDFEQMKALSQPELASVYAERMTYAALQRDSSKDRGGIGTGST
jgi:hypothetical protein